MPMLQFKCECGNEFEKIMPAKHELYKWCKNCNRLTIWETILDPHHMLYREKVCTECMGSANSDPLLSPESVPTPKVIQETCPTCGKQAEHVLRIETRGTRSGGPGISDSSVRFHFNYLSPTDS